MEKNRKLLFVVILDIDDYNKKCLHIQFDTSTFQKQNFNNVTTTILKKRAWLQNYVYWYLCNVDNIDNSTYDDLYN